MSKPSVRSGAANPDNEKQQSFALLRDISLAIARAESSTEVFSDVLAHICQAMDWPIGHVYLWSDSAGAYVSTCLWYLKDSSRYATFREFTEVTEYPLGQGTIGRLAERGEPLILSDILDDETFDRQLPVDEGVCAYFAFPVRVDERVEAIFEFCADEPDVPDELATAIIDHAIALTELAIKAERNLQRFKESEERLTEAQRVARIAHWEWDVVRDRIIWSSELYRMFGVKPEELEPSYEGTIVFVHPDDVEFVMEKIQAAYEGEASLDYYHRIVRQDGEVRLIHERVQSQHDPAGNLVRMYGTAQDVTEQKEGELRLAQSVRQLAALMEIGQAVASTFDLSEIYERVLSLVRPLLEAETLILLIYDAEEDNFEVVARASEEGLRMGLDRLSLAPSILAEVWRTQQSQLATGDMCRRGLHPDLEAYSDYMPGSILAVPVTGHGHSIGVLRATHSSEDAFSDDHCRLLETAAEWTAVAIGNAERYQTLQHRLREKDALSAISNAILAASDVRTFLRFIVSQVRDTVPRADLTMIHLLNEVSGDLELAASAGANPPPAAHRLETTEGGVASVMARHRVVSILDAGPESCPFVAALGESAGAVLMVPIESQVRTMGMLTAVSAKTGIFTREDERLLRILGVQTGTAIENVRLHEAQQQARERAERQAARIRTMAYRIVEAQEDERARIARELHDEVGQALTSITISLALVGNELPEELSPVRSTLNDVQGHVSRTLGELRLLAHNLRPPGLEQFGLDAALAGLVEEYRAVAGQDIRYTGTELSELNESQAITLYRFVQEALTNAVKHAQAGRIQVALTRDDSHVKVSVDDDGRGFEPPESLGGETVRVSGLVGMLERLELVDGHLTINSRPGNGARLTAVVPYIEKST